MKKNLIAFLLLCCLLVAGCSSKTTKIDLTDNTGNTVDTEKDEASNQVLFDKDVDIVLYRMSFDNSSIEDYVAKLQEENPDKVYSVYDDNHYVVTIKESERRALVEEMKDDEYISEMFKDVFTDEQYGGAFISMEYDELFQNITFYADKDAYQAAGISASFGSTLVAMMYSDFVQAYNLIPLEERIYNVVIIDEATGEILYDSGEK